MKVHLALFLAILLAATSSARRAAAEDLFPDKNLEAAVRQQVFEKRNKPDPLVEVDVVNISVVRGAGKKITNLQGLEKCKALAELSLDNNEIPDLEPIKDLKLIQLLNLG